MRPYIRLLVERLRDAGQPLSRNRHYDTFANPHGRRALRISRHLQSLAKDIVETKQAGGPVRVERQEADGQVLVRLEIIALKARRTAFLSAEEFELLLESHGVREALEAA